MENYTYITVQLGDELFSVAVSPKDLSSLDKFLLSHGMPIYKFYTPDLVISSEGDVLRKCKKLPYFYFVKTCLNTSGYPQVHTSLGTRTVHSLVAELFLEDKPDKSEVDHIDGNKLNNSYSNLRWLSHQENSSLNKVKTPYPPHTIVGTKTEVVLGKSLKEVLTQVFGSNIPKGSSSAIRRACERGGGYAYGYHWSYK